MSKRRILVSALLVVLAFAGLAAQPDEVDLLLINGKVFTADPAAPWAEAVALRGNRIAAPRRRSASSRAPIPIASMSPAASSFPASTTRTLMLERVRRACR